MNVVRLALREVMHRRLSALLGALGVALASACLVGAASFLRAHDRRTDAIVAAKESQTAQEMRKLDDDYRKITKNLGFNVLILPRDQSLADLYADDFAAKLMPESHAAKLANSGVITVQHILPSLQQKITWPEAKRTILLFGTRGEVPVGGGDEKSPIQPPVKPGQIVLGFELHQSLGVKPGDGVTLLGEKFTVSKAHEQRGTKDDITAWIDLATAQRLLGKEGWINGILALECKCAWADLPKVREEITRILPDTQVIEFRTNALARAEARNRAERAGVEAVEAEKQHRAALRRERESQAAVVVPLAIAVAAAWVAGLAFVNVRDRRDEIGILRAIGVGGAKVQALFLLRAVCVGLVGAAVGVPLGLAAPALIEGASPLSQAWSPAELLTAGVTLLVAPLLAAAAAYVPTQIAAGQDPAVILQTS